MELLIQPMDSHTAPEEQVVELTRQLGEAREQQAAAAEILRAISQTPADIQPVFDTIARSAVRLCGAQYSNVFRFDGEMLHLVAHHNFTPEILDLMQRLYPMQPTREQLSGRAILAKAVVQVEDIRADPEYLKRVARIGGWRSILAVPMLLDGMPVGVININLTEPGAFSERQIELLKTFAAQAVVAIENSRLFNEAQDKTRQLELANQFKARFLAAASHDLRQPLHALNLFIAQLRAESDVSERRRLISQIRRRRERDE